MDMKIEREGPVMRVFASGELIGLACNTLRDTIKSAVDDSTASLSKVVIDLSGLSFIDSSGIGVLMGLKAHLRTRKVEFTLVNPSPKILQILKVTRLDKVFGLSDG